jgi:hypothetical protein
MLSLFLKDREAAKYGNESWNLFPLWPVMVFFSKTNPSWKLACHWVERGGSDFSAPRWRVLQTVLHAGRFKILLGAGDRFDSTHLQAAFAPPLKKSVRNASA